MAEEKMLAVGDGPLHLSEHLYQSIPNYQLIDALPFIDPFGQEDFARVEEMIQKEIATFEPSRDFLELLPLPSCPYLDSSPFVKEAMEKIKANGGKLPKEGLSERINPSDYSRAHLPLPSKASSVEAWEECRDKTKVSIVDTAENNEYLDVATKYSVPQWIHGKLQVSAFEQSLVKKRKALAKEVEDIQKRRKLDQMSHGNVLRSLHREELEFETNNFETECATMAMEADLRRLRQIIDSDPQRKAEVPVNLVEALSEVLDGAKPTDQENASSTV
ncbi:hypothetical protein Pmar_PMAR019512 [Perkinsus marinus ATCC 50983]|uniref:Pre-mRNA-splicing factor SPF27 n=1 Tax=Perkinsus marinus (strain ATCC 50983 / TXsc) TaxID=423536 RepID=C5KR82_PERM5|nr:hypothetical protein Pmar_PMAR019512 [Perkinsus marinus ATCC 50983]EER12983.1 hypothetical protein Pmar_PMAR019512 [Perkinsus marinus ATCC 50983]|eukprot:XP_002781188.1 hypothetical protein Pmar_PMAR019512 [Perkinsus marinus ATCC 50983]